MTHRDGHTSLLARSPLRSGALYRKAVGDNVQKACLLPEGLLWRSLWVILAANWYYRIQLPRIMAIAFFLALFLPQPVAFSAAQSANTGTGLPLPRFASIRADQVNLRTGPGVQYPIDWVYQRQDLPVEIIAEYRTWRKIRDWQSTQGWVHQSMLSGKRTTIAIGKQRTLRDKPDAKSTAVAKIEAGAIADLVECPPTGGWCRIEQGGISGWLRKVEFWGAYRNEIVK